MGVVCSQYRSPHNRETRLFGTGRKSAHEARSLQSIPYTMTKEVCYYEARRAYPNARYINYHSNVCSVVMNGNEPAVSGYKPWWVSSYAQNVCQVY